MFFLYGNERRKKTTSTEGVTGSEITSQNIRCRTSGKNAAWRRGRKGWTEIEKTGGGGGWNARVGGLKAYTDYEGKRERTAYDKWTGIERKRLERL